MQCQPSIDVESRAEEPAVGFLERLVKHGKGDDQRVGENVNGTGEGGVFSTEKIG